MIEQALSKFDTIAEKPESPEKPKNVVESKPEKKKEVAKPPQMARKFQNPTGGHKQVPHKAR